MSNLDPAYKYVPARLQWPRSGNVTPCLIVMHSMEGPEMGTTAENCAQWFQNRNSTGSAHLCVDNNSIVQCVPYNIKSAGARGSLYKRKTVNDWAIHIEQAGLASQTAAQWSDNYSQAMLFWAAAAAAKLCKQFNIPPKWCDEASLRAGTSGITSHAVVSKAFNVSGGHWDPGPNWPKSVFLQAVANWLAQL